MKKILFLILVLLGTLTLSSCILEVAPTPEEPVVEEPVVEEPVVEEPVTEEPVTEEPVVEPEPVVTTYEYNFGVDTKFGYGEGELVWTEGETTYTAAKNRVQINKSTFGVRAELDAFLVFAPIQDNNYAYIEFEIGGPSVITFDHIGWHSVNTPPAVQGLTLAEIRVELYNTETEAWDVVDSLDLKTRIDGEVLVAEELNVLVAGLYRISYYIEGATSTTNTTYALIVDNLKVVTTEEGE